MSLLNQLFNRGILGAKCKTCLTLAVSRIKLVQNKRYAQLRLMRKEIAEFLQAGQEAIARIRVEHVIREQNTWEAYDIIELFCEFVLARVPILDNNRECPKELQEAVASIIFSAPRCSDLPDLLQVRNLFAAKYGKEFIAAASELRPDTSVNRTIIEKLSVSAPPAHVKIKVLKEIALENNVYWDSTKTEQEFSKKPEDLLNGPKQIGAQPLSVSDSRLQVQKGAHQSAASSNGKLGERYMHSPTSSSTSSVETRRIKSSTREQNPKPVTEIKNLNPAPSDALERARAAISAAERATAAARAAAELVNVRFTPIKQEEQKT